jgi:nucleoid-associated protein YgaU
LGKWKTAQEPALDMADSYISPAQDTGFTTDPYPSYGSPTEMETTYEPETTLVSSTGPRYHTVVKRDTLYALARMYYGDHHKWKSIYEANRSSIGDPNRIRIGQRLVIP